MKLKMPPKYLIRIHQNIEAIKWRQTLINVGFINTLTTRNRQSRQCLFVRAYVRSDVCACEVLYQTFNTALSQRVTLYNSRGLFDLIIINISLFLWRAHEACTPVINRPASAAFSGLVDGVAAVNNGCWSRRFLHQDTNCSLPSSTPGSQFRVPDRTRLPSL